MYVEPYHLTVTGVHGKVSRPITFRTVQLAMDAVNAVSLYKGWTVKIVDIRSGELVKQFVAGE